MPGSVLIGDTGLVGGTLARARPFDVTVNSRTVGDLRGGRFDLVVCAGVRAVKWQANQAPEADRAGIAALTEVLQSIAAREFVLISTIDVYPDPAQPADEDTPIDPAANHPYGRHRFELERWVEERFPAARVVRLPALFGEGLKKNVLFDLLHGHRTEAVNPASSFQWYPLRRLAADLDRLRTHDLRRVNLFPEPVGTSEILAAFFPGLAVGPRVLPAPSYDLRTRWSELLGGPPGYALDRTTVLGELARYVARVRGG